MAEKLVKICDECNNKLGINKCFICDNDICENSSCGRAMDFTLHIRNRNNVDFKPFSIICQTCLEKHESIICNESNFFDSKFSKEVITAILDYTRKKLIANNLQKVKK